MKGTMPISNKLLGGKDIATARAGLLQTHLSMVYPYAYKYQNKTDGYAKQKEGEMGYWPERNSSTFFPVFCLRKGVWLEEEDYRSATA
jgi:hypothetical protein